MNLQMEEYLYQMIHGDADYSELYKNTYTVKTPLYLNVSDETGLNIGENVNILEIKDVYFQDLKLKRESGDIVDVALTYADRIL